MRSVWLIAIVCVACGDDGSSDPAATAPRPAAATAQPPATNETNEADDPLAGLDDGVDPDVVAADAVDPAAVDPTEVGGNTATSSPPSGGCDFADEAASKIWQRPAVADIVEVGDGFAVAGYAQTDDGGEEVFVVTLRPGALPRPVYRAQLEAPLRGIRSAPPGFAARDGGHVALAVTDRRSRVLYAQLTLAAGSAGASGGSLREIAHGADQRYAPALAFAPEGDGLVAWADGASDRPRVRLARVSRSTQPPSVRDLTPVSAGATCPVIVGDALLFADHRQGMSNLYWAQLPHGEPQVLRPVSHLFDPLALTAARWGERWLVGYTAIGRAATTAVGMVIAEGARTPGPKAIVAGAGYGRLHVDAQQRSHSVVFAADAPTARERGAPRRIEVRVATRAGELGPSLVVTGPGGTASDGSIAAYEDLLGVVFRGTDGAYVRLLRCDDSGRSPGDGATTADEAATAEATHEAAAAPAHTP